MQGDINRIKKNLYIEKKLIYTLILILINLSLVLNKIPLCSDTGNYLTHPGYGFSLGSPDSLLYSFLFLIKNNIVWFKTLQVISVVFFNFALYLLPINSQRLFIGSLIPWIFSIIGLHFWSCGIRNAIGFSSFVLSYSLKNTDKYTNHSKFKFAAILISLIFAILCHWTLFLLTPFVFFPKIISSFIKFTRNTILINYKIKIELLIIILITILATLLFIFIGDFSKILSYGIFTRREAYGTVFPYVMILNLSLFYITSKNCLARYSEIQTYFILIFICSVLPIVGVNPLIIRFQLQFWVIFLISLLIYQKNINQLVLYLSISSPPFIFYLIENYPKYYFN